MVISRAVEALVEFEATNISMRIIDPNFDQDAFWKHLNEYCESSCADKSSTVRHCVRRKAANESLPWEQ